MTFDLMREKFHLLTDLMRVFDLFIKLKGGEGMMEETSKWDG